jgi:uncharacterized protein YyaL (SSP411 family)
VTQAPANRLASATSPYLLQHAHNPVDWYPWGEEALEKAQVEDKPIFLSIGYSACHWCHVMERESFEDEGIANLLNAHFVPIKVDREERPDLDEIYMEAVQAITGRGGWPMSVWLMPDLKPFFGGTYFPRESRQGMPGFRQLLERIAELWGARRQDLARDAAELAESLRRQGQGFSEEGMPDETVFEGALQFLRRDFDPRWGGFGAAPKFPAHLAVELILRRGSAEDRAMAMRTLDAMFEGGMYDHLGGGFARYSVDGQWLVPHFEKMLYDNAQLATCYLYAFQATGERRYAKFAQETLDYLLRDLWDPAGGFHSSEDADSEGEEGRFYAFSPAEIEAELEPEDAALFCEAYGISRTGNFEHGKSVLHRFSAPNLWGPQSACAPRQGRQGAGLLEWPGSLGLRVGVSDPRRGALPGGCHGLRGLPAECALERRHPLPGLSGWADPDPSLSGGLRRRGARLHGSVRSRVRSGRSAFRGRSGGVAAGTVPG